MVRLMGDIRRFSLIVRPITLHVIAAARALFPFWKQLLPTDGSTGA